METPATSQQPVVEIGGFEVITRLGEGGMGQVFKARQKSIDRLVALKVLTPKLAQDADYVQRFEREAKAAGQLTHPNIVGVIDRGEQTSGPIPVRWIAFEFIDGTSLEGRVKKGRLSEREALKVVRDIAEALRYASDKGLIHRDVKPDNILLTSDGTPKLADLGLAKFTHDNASLTQTGIVMGTPHYMAPEQALGERDLDVRADVYALGLVLYRCVTGEIPFMADSALAILTRHINQDCPDPRAIVPELSEGLVQLLRGMTARKRELRFRPDEVTEKASALLLRLASGVSSSSKRAAVAVAPPPADAAPTAGTKPVSKPQPAPIPKTGPGSKAIPPTKALPAPAPAKEPLERESRIALVLAFAVCALLASGVTLVLKKRPKPVTPDDGVTAVASDGSGGPVKTPPDATLPAGALSTDELVKRLRAASVLAAERPSDARALLDALARGTPAAAEPLAIAVSMVDAIDSALGAVNDPALARDSNVFKEKTDGIRSRLLGLTKPGPRNGPLDEAVRDEARGWHAATGAIFGALAFLRGLDDPPSEQKELPASGARDALGDTWRKAVVGELEPAIRSFERRDWKDARRHAEAARAALVAPFFKPIAESAATIALLATRLEAAPGDTPLDAFGRLKPAERTSRFLARFGSLDCTGANAAASLPAFLLKNTFEVKPALERGGFAVNPFPALRKGELFREGGDSWLAQGERVVQLRLIVEFETDGAEAVYHIRPRFGVSALFLGANGKTKGFSNLLNANVIQKESFAAVAATKHTGATHSQVQDFIWLPDADGHDLEVRLDGATAPSTMPLRHGEHPVLRGNKVTIKRVEWLARR